MTAPHICTANIRGGATVSQDSFFGCLQMLCHHILTCHSDVQGPKGQFVVCCQPELAANVECFMARYVESARHLAAAMGLMGTIHEPTASDMVLIDMPPEPGTLLSISIKLPEQERLNPCPPTSPTSRCPNRSCSSSSSSISPTPYRPSPNRSACSPRGSVAELPRNPERTVALRKLLEAKDAAVRARIYY